MGGNTSKALFEVANEFYVAISSGFLGMAILVNHGIRTNHIVGTLFVTSVAIGSLMYAFSSCELATPSKRKIVFIIGCDSGLGYSLAEYCNDLGFTVIAGCVDISSDGAKKLANLPSGNINIIDLDVTDSTSVHRSYTYLKSVLGNSPDNELWAVVYNAGILVFGEFEWQTEKLMQKQLDVNLVGAMRVTKKMCPLLRKYKARLINITSHCASSTLPGLAVYGASKAGLKGLSDALRVEMNKYGVKIIMFVPGSFVNESNIMARHTDHVYEMRSAFSQEQEDFYGSYFLKYNSYLGAVAIPSLVKRIENPHLYAIFKSAILSEFPKPNYSVEPIRYTLYHMLFKISPTIIRDFFVIKFMAMPTYVPSEDKNMTM